MAKIKVILVAEDEIYLAPIENKFLEELGYDIDLEVISDREYFNEYFSQPKSSDIMIVSEEFYTKDIEKHNIKNIYVLVEKINDEQLEIGISTKIFKYTSTKEIFNEVMAFSNVLRMQNSPATKETKVVLCYSASGGVGKTTLALGVSRYLSKRHKKVLYINAEMINTFQSMLENSTAIDNRWCGDFMNCGADIYTRIKHCIRNEGFDYLPPFSMAISALNIEYSVYKEIINAAKMSKEYDVIMVDTNTVFDEQKSELITLADKVIMIVEQTKHSVAAMNMLLKNMSCSDTEKYCFVCNKYNSAKTNSIVTGQKINFVVSEYIDEIEDMEVVSLQEMSNKPEIQKVGILVE